MKSSSSPALPAASSTALGYVAALLLPGITTLLATPLLGKVGLENIVPLYLVGVVMATLGWGRGPGLVASLVSVLCFDVFFVPPRFSLTVAESESLITFAVLFGVSLVISHLTATVRRKSLEVEQRAAEAELLYALTRDLADAASLVEVEARVNDALERHLGLGARLLVPDARQRLVAIEGGLGAVGELERLIATGVLVTGHASPINPDLRDDAFTLLLPLPGADGPRGVLAMHEPKAAELREIPANLGAALAALVSIAVERTATRR